MIKAVVVMFAAILAVIIAQAQEKQAEEKLTFEAASIKLAAPNATRSTRPSVPSPNRVSISSMTLRTLVYAAYGEGLGTSVSVRGGPDWANRTSYAVEAVAQISLTERMRQAMLRTLLEDRFKLKIRTSTEYHDVYALVPARTDGKLGPGVQEWNGACQTGNPTGDDDPSMPQCVSGYRPPGIVLEGATMFSAAEILSLPQSRVLLGRVVQDRTGLAARYNMRLEYPFATQPVNPGALTNFGPPSLFTAVQEQWGLKLEPAKGPLKVINIESAEPPSEN